MRTITKIALATAGGLTVVVIVAGVVGGSPASPASPYVAPDAPVTYVTPDPAAAAPAAAPQYTSAQQQVIDAAEGYLTDGQGFSRAGLIQQLHSPYGNGFSKSLARFAVNHISVNWRNQAVIAARGYMADGQGFSYDSLVQQLSSPYGSQFTLSQAEYAAKAVGL